MIQTENAMDLDVENALSELAQLGESFGCWVES